MKNKKQNEELQNRREFFKSAAKKALPIIGVIALCNVSFSANAAQFESTGCEKACVGSCGVLCTGCWTGCSGCKADCQHDCKNHCSGSCKSGCGHLANDPGW